MFDCRRIGLYYLTKITIKLLIPYIWTFTDKHLVSQGHNYSFQLNEEKILNHAHSPGRETP